MSATEMVNHPTDGAIPRRPQQGVCSFHIESAKATYRFTRGNCARPAAASPSGRKGEIRRSLEPVPDGGTRDPIVCIYGRSGS